MTNPVWQTTIVNSQLDISIAVKSYSSLLDQNNVVTDIKGANNLELNSQLIAAMRSQGVTSFTVEIDPPGALKSFWDKNTDTMIIVTGEGTSRNKIDTDGDGISDGLSPVSFSQVYAHELKHGWQGETTEGQESIKVDTDEDGIGDTISSTLMEKGAMDHENDMNGLIGAPERNYKYSPQFGITDNGLEDGHTYQLQHWDDKTWEGARAVEKLILVEPRAGDIDFDIDHLSSLPDVNFEDWLENVDDQFDESAEAPGYMDNIIDQFVASLTRGSPLILDLDGDGIELSAYANNNTSFFDLDQDGFAERTGWVNSDDGILVLDANNDGRIQSNAELFGTMDTDGFTVAREYDLNADGVLSLEDAVWSDLQIWRDLDQDGVSDAGELTTLDSHNILSINLNATEVSQTNQGHDVTHTSTYTYDTGSGTATRAIHDVWFTFDNVATRYAQDYTFDMRAAYLPSQRGYGVLADLHIAMSLDNAGTGNLLDMVDTLNDKTFAQLFDSTNGTLDAVRDIMYRWAGVEGVVAGSRGVSMDAKELAFLEKLMGQDFLQNGYVPNPGSEASWNLSRGFNIALNSMYARLVGQAAGGELFEGDFHYNIATDAIEGITGLNATAIGLLETEATGLSTTAEKTTFWQNVARIVEFNIGYANLSVGDQDLLDDAIVASDATLNLVGIITSLDVSENQYGQDDNDLLQGDSFTNDTLFGYAGDDRLEGMNGNDELTGGTGQDYLLGGGGQDVYHYASGDGYDVILEAGKGSGNDADEIRFAAGIDSGDLTFTRLGDKGLIIDIDNGTDVGQIWLESQFNNASNGPGYVEIIRFSDNSTLDLMTLDHTTYGTASNDILWGIGEGGGGSDTIYGGAGNDLIYGHAPNSGDPDTNWLYGEAGNDTINGGSTIDHIYGGDGNDTLNGNAGNDILWDGAGDDHLNGGTGDDVYHYTGGHDVYLEAGGTGDAIHLDAVWNGITPVYYKQGIDLKIVFDENNTILIDNQFSSYSIETMVYADSTSVTLSGVSYVVQGDETNNSLYGTGNADTLYGFGGDDYITGNNGDDALYGGTGNDTLVGGYGNNYLDGGAGNDTVSGGFNNDTFVYVSGHDIFNEASGTDVVLMADGWTAGDLTFRRYAANLNDLVVEINGSNSITMNDQFYNHHIDTIQFSDASTINLLTRVYETHGNSSNNTLSGISAGGSINDIFFGYAGVDTLNGGNGNDTIYGGEGNDNINGQNDNDTLYGEDGDDSIDGGYGNDYLDGGIGNDNLLGSGGNDTFFYQSGNDTIFDGAGTDVLKLSSDWTVSNLTFRREIADLENLKIQIDGSNSILITNQFYGDNNVDTLEFSDASTINLMTKVYETHGDANNNTIGGIQWGGSLNDIIYGYAGNDTLNGGNGDDILYGGDDVDTLNGGEGADTLYGDAGNDSLSGAGGNDILIGGAGNDALDGGNSGNDVYIYSAGLDTIGETNGTDNLHITGYTIDDISIANHNTYDTKITINASVDEIIITNHRNVYWYQIEGISFDDGFDTNLVAYQTWTNGTTGADTLTGTSGDNTIIGKAGADTLDGAGGADDIHGGAGNDVLYGGAGADLLHGGVDNDTLYGQDGLDTLFGGAGADTFVFETATAFNNVDVVKDFSTAQNDVLDLSDLLGGFDPLNDAITDFVWITESAGNSNVFVDRDGLGGTYSLTAIASLTNTTGLTDEAALLANGHLLAA